MKCLFSKSKKFEKIFSFPKIGILMRVENSKLHKSIKRNINFFINKDTGSIQIHPKISPSVLYKRAHGSGMTGKTWKNHHDQFFKQCKPYLFDKVLEIGGGDNSIVKNKNFNFKKIKIFYSIGKNLKISLKKKKILKINNFFNRKILDIKKIKKLNLVVHSHFFEHLLNPDVFLKTIYNSLNIKGYHIFSVPNITSLLRQECLTLFFLNIRIIMTKKL